MQIPPRGASRQMGEMYAKIFIAIHIHFFQKLTYRSDRLADFCVRWLKLEWSSVAEWLECWTQVNFTRARGPGFDSWTDPSKKLPGLRTV